MQKKSLFIGVHLWFLHPNTVHNNENHKSDTDDTVDVEESHVHLRQIILFDQRMLINQKTGYQHHPSQINPSQENRGFQ